MWCRDTSGISVPFGTLFRTLGQVTNVLLTRLPLTSHYLAVLTGPYDLHALDTPPAFILSQDQTLRRSHSPGGLCFPSFRDLSVPEYSTEFDVVLFVSR